MPRGVLGRRGTALGAQADPMRSRSHEATIIWRWLTSDSWLNQIETSDPARLMKRLAERNELLPAA